MLSDEVKKLEKRCSLFIEYIKESHLEKLREIKRCMEITGVTPETRKLHIEIKELEEWLKDCEEKKVPCSARIIVCEGRNMSSNTCLLNKGHEGEHKFSEKL